ncbi:MAG: N-acetylmuramoyl-L-alanine amidase [Bacteroidales bacterium]|nr:N-acetylmuramoyl-L-alanine amidase [Bacteroidales bacterium]
MLLSLPTMAEDDRFTVVLDPGHGGKDPGALGKTSREKNIVLSVAKKVGKRLQDNHSKDIRLIYTRDKDVFIELEQRAKIANNAHADIFISIHADCVDNKKVHGAGTFTMGMNKEKSNLEVAKRENSVMLLEDNYQQKYAGFDPSSVESYIIFELMQNVNMENSIKLAKYIQNNLVAQKRTDRGVRQAPYWVLHRTSMPAVLIELGFISNLEEEKYMNSEKGQNELAESIYQAICSYKKEHDKLRASVKNLGSQPQVSQAGSEEVSENGQPVSGIRYSVQILTARSEIKANDRQFKGQRDVICYKEKDLFKYCCGSYLTEKEAIARKNELKKSFPDAFVIALKDGVRIPLTQARAESQP